MIITDRELFTLQDIAKLRKCSIQAVHQLAKRRKITGKRMGFIRVFNQRDVDRMMVEDNGKENE